MCMDKIAVALVCVAALIASERLAFAQAGSTGGTIGKTDKSVSGGAAENAQARDRLGASGRRNKDRSTLTTNSRTADTSGRPCAHIAGVWTYPHGDATFRPDGSIVSAGSDGATWTCSEGHVTVVWKGGSGFVDRLTLSADGMHLVGSNNWG